MKITNYFALGLLLSTFSAAVYGQQVSTGGKVLSVERNKSDNTPTSVFFAPGAGLHARDAQTIFREYLGISQPNSEMVLYSTTQTKQHTTVYRYAQYYKGIKVEHSCYSLMAKDDKAQFITGNIYNITQDIPGVPVLNESSALAKAIEKVGAEKYMWQDTKMEQFLKKQTKNPDTSYLPKGNLVWIEDRSTGHSDRQLHLAYGFNIYAKAPYSREMVYVDAINGKILFVNSLLHCSSGNGQSLYSGNVNFRTSKFGGTYYLNDSTRGAGINTFRLLSDTSIADNTSGSTTWATDAALDAHWGAANVYDYWYTQQGRISFDNAGAAINNYVHFGINFSNAFWTGSEMIYGDGNIADGFTPFVAQDVVAHEIGHGVCQYTAGLIYEGESGAINEGLSDIWGAVITNYADPHETDAQPKLIWTHGEEYRSVPTRRSLENPKTYLQPDTYGGLYWVDPIACIPDVIINDYCGVHINSGVLNHWFYLMSQGGTGVNDNGNAYNVTGIGINAGADIVYQTELMLSSTADYDLCRTTSISAATVLYGACSPEVQAVVNAWHAVGVGKAFNPMAGSITGATNVCIGTSISLTDTFSAGTWGSLNTAIATVSSTGIVSGITAGKAAITYTAVTACGTFSDTATIKVNTVPAPLTVTPASDTICNNGAVTISAPLAVLPNMNTVLSEDFESGMASWTVDNTGSAGLSPYSPWSIVPNGTLNRRSPDNSNFAISYPLSGAPGAITQTRLISPTFSLADYTAATLSYQHYYRYKAGDSSVSVEVSTDTGTTWTTLQNYSPTYLRDGYFTFRSRSISLDQYAGMSNLKIRFYYHTTSGDIWTLDNVIITGTTKATFTTPSWSPVADLFIDAALTVPYITGTKTNTVYTHPTTIATPTVKTYTATSQGGGCSATGVSAVRVAPVPSFSAITAKPGTIIKSGQNDTLQAVVTNPGSSQTYQWKVNATYISGAVSATYTSNAFADRDTVTCIVTTDGPCGPTMESRSVVIYISNLGVKNIADDVVVTIAPNPNKGTFTITGALNTTTNEEVSLEIVNLIGQVVYSSKTTASGGQITEQVQLSPDLANGIYILNLHTGIGNKVFRFVLEQ